jgi:hypothetical protein
MKKSVFNQLVVLSLILVLAASCRSGVVVSYPRPGSSTAKSLPPGQAKKVYGHQSARAFAPGQQKKQGVQVSSPGNGNGHYKKGKKKK